MNTLENSSLLKAKGLKVTNQRLAVLKAFQDSSRRHLSAEDIYRGLINAEPEIAFATVYRVLTQLSDAGILTSTHFESGKATFELNEGGHHDHMICVSCGAVVEFYDKKIEDLQEFIAQQHGFRLLSHSLALYGLCSHSECKG